MTRNEQLSDVIRLACLTEHRTNCEQRSLIAWAWDCDKQHNRNTNTNQAQRDPKWQPQDLVSEVNNTRDLHTDEGDRVVPPPKRWAETWARWRTEWDAS